MCTQMKVNNSGSTFVSLVVKGGHLLRKLVGRGGLFHHLAIGFACSNGYCFHCWYLLLDGKSNDYDPCDKNCC